MSRLMSKFRDEGHEAVAALFKEAEGCQAIPSEAVIDAAAFAAATMVDDRQPVTKRLGIAATLTRELYRAGYNAGKRDLQTQLNANEG